MSTVFRPLGYIGQLNRLTWNFPPATIQAYLWGAGGGGGGDEGSDDPGGNGGGGGFARYDFTVNTGDTIDVAVGQGGQGGTRTPGSTVGAGGRSVRYLVFDTRDQSGVVPVTNGAWSSFMNSHAVWDAGGSSVTPIFRSYTVNFPVTGYYVFQYSVDNTMSVDFDGVNIISYSGFTADPPPFISRLVTAGNHTVNITASNSGGPAGVALTIDASYSGANGGSGSSGSNGGGSGGGGGGATVLIINDVIVAVAGGGAGGGGAGGNGNTPGTTGPDAPGPWLYPPASESTINTTVPQAGQGAPSTGGGGGGGGGGRSAGNGGRRGGASPSNPIGAGDFNATAGSFGQSFSTGAVANPNGRTPGGTDSPYYTGASVGGFGGTRWSSANGQPGGNGYAAFVLDISGLSVRDSNLWKKVREQYIRDGNQWRPIQNIYVREEGQWQLVYGTNSAIFGTTASDWGQYSRRAG